jgi:transmembrane sensor
MNSEQDKEQRLTELVDKLQTATDEDWASLADDDEALEVARTIGDIRQNLLREHTSIDTEEALRTFHKRLDEESLPQSSSSHLRYLWWMVAALAAAVLLFFVLRPATESTSLPPGTVYVAHHVKSFRLSIDGKESLRQPLEKGRETYVEKKDYQTIPADTSRVDLQVPFGQTAAVDLPDGSKVYLHAGSRLIFPAHYRNGVRWASLEGEAYFVVTHDAARPFTVFADGVETKVLGTEFNVDATEHHQTRVTLVTGHVKVSGNGHQCDVKPGEQATVTDGGIATSTVDVDRYTNWRDGYFYFNDYPLATILTEVGREYNVTVRFRNANAQQVRTHFAAPRNISLSELIEQVNRMGKVHVTLNANREIEVY